MKTPVVVLYGGQSSEHDVSLVSAKFALEHLDRDLFDVYFIGITRSGSWFWQNIESLDLHDKKEPLPIFENQPVFSRPDLAHRFYHGPLDVLVQHVADHRGALVEPSEICFFPFCHGQHVEDGHLQGMLELSGYGFVGPDTRASAIGMDKTLCKKLAETVGISVVPYVAVQRTDWDKNSEVICQSITEKLGTKLFIKPNSLGSAVGVYKIDQATELKGAVERALGYDRVVLVEKAVAAREIECAALGGYEPEISIPGEVNPTGEFYSYDAKYKDAEGAKILIPAALSPEETSEIQLKSKLIYETLGLYGMSRIDWFLDRDTKAVYFNEVNTLPGMTSISQYPLLWKHGGVDGSELLTRLVELGLERARDVKRYIQASPEQPLG